MLILNSQEGERTGTVVMFHYTDYGWLCLKKCAVYM